LLTLALGIGVNTAIFSLINSILINPLPFAGSGSLVNIWAEDPQSPTPDVAISAADFADLKEQSNSFESLVVFTSRRFNITGIPEPDQIQGARVSGGLFALLGAAPLKGRTFGPENDRDATVAVVSHRAWRDLLGGDENV